MRLILPALLLCLPASASAQLSLEHIRTGLHSRFGNGEWIESGAGGGKEDKRFLENILELDSGRPG
jgi:hypothetical protein